MRIVITSGFFNPIHRGHISYLNVAKSYADKLIVIVNNDKQVVIKKSVIFMSEIDRKLIVDNLKCVDESIIAIDNDISVCKTLEFLRKQYPNDELIFAKGGDRNINNIPEVNVCKQNNIDLLFGIGDEKTISSTDIKNRFENKVKKPWGYYQYLINNINNWVKLLVVEPRQRLSLQSHNHRNEQWIIIDGKAKVQIDNDEYILNTNDIVNINKNQKHRVTNNTNDYLYLLEFAHGELLSEDDIKRWSDDYDRR